MCPTTSAPYRQLAATQCGVIHNIHLSSQPPQGWVSAWNPTWTLRQSKLFFMLFSYMSRAQMHILISSQMMRIKRFHVHSDLLIALMLSSLPPTLHVMLKKVAMIEMLLNFDILNLSIKVRRDCRGKLCPLVCSPPLCLCLLVSPH